LGSLVGQPCQQGPAIGARRDSDHLFPLLARL